MAKTPFGSDVSYLIAVGGDVFLHSIPLITKAKSIRITASIQTMHLVRFLTFYVKILMSIKDKWKRLVSEYSTSIRISICRSTRRANVCYIAPVLPVSDDPVEPAVNFLSSALRLPLEPNSIPVRTANAPAVMPYMNISSVIFSLSNMPS